MKKIFSLFISAIICLNLSAQNIGIGTITPTQKLDVVGNLKLSGTLMPGGNAGTVGQVLTSSGAGLAPVWESPIVFMAHLTGGSTVIINNNATATLPWGAEVFDEGNDFSTGIFTAPQNGIYHFAASVKWGSNNSSGNFVQATLQKCDNAGNNCEILVSSKLNNQVSAQQTFSANAKLVAGEKVKVVVTQTNTDVAGRSIETVDTNDNIPSFFSGHLVR